MSYEMFVEKDFRADTMEVIVQANHIIQDYQAQGYILTLRQLYYQFVARDLLPNTERSYKRLGKILSDGRLAGLIDWEAIEDRGRQLEENNHWASPAQIIQTCADSFRYNLWKGQETIVEVWIEKQALLGVIERPCVELDIPYFACKGYVSQSEMWRAGRRSRGRRTVILHLGDHDPSGMDMTRDNQDRVLTFAAGSDVEVVRIALNMDQIEDQGPPPNPTKLTDSRAGPYLDQYGDESWELDALTPDFIEALIREHVEPYIDHDLMDEQRDEQNEARRQLQALSDDWDKISENL